MIRGVGAALVSIILFSSIIIMNAMIISFREDELSLLVISNELRRIKLEAFVSKQAIVLEALNRIEFLISKTDIRCSSAIQTISKLADLRLYYNSTMIHTSIATSLSSSTNAYDNLSSISPFNGNKYNAINLIAQIEQYGASPDGMVGYEKSEVHYFNIPANLNGAISICLSVKGDVIRHLSSLKGKVTCSQDVLKAIKEDIYSAYGGEASHEGLLLELTLSPFGLDCSTIHYAILVYQTVNGVYNSFALTLYEDGSILI